MANSYLSRTFGTPTSGTTWTFSAWVKKSSNGSAINLCSRLVDGSNEDRIRFTSGDALEWSVYKSGSYAGRLVTNRLFRDNSAFYHIVCRWDTTNGTAGDRMRIYVNGTEETSFSTDTNPSSSITSNFNSSGTNYVGSVGSGEYFNGYMSHVAFVDGQALAPTVFGETDSTSGIWKFKPPSGVTWGTNGFHLKFENSGALGTDSSGNTNTFTVQGNLKQSLDTPSNVHATWNPLSPNDSITYSNGNTTVTGSNSTNYSMSCSTTLGASAGKWYWEMKHTTANANTNTCIGVANLDNYEYNQNITSGTTGYVTLRFDGERQINGATTSSYFSTPSAGDILMCAMDMDNGKVFFGNNGTWFGSGNPATGANPTADILTSGTWGGTLRYLAAKFECNFGNGFFGTTAISSAGSNGNGSLFEYDVPSGYYALNTKNINTYG
jgi:hypothetical protein